MCFEQYSHEFYVAVALFLHHLPEAPDPEVFAEKHAKGYAALDIMEQHLSGNNFFAGNQYTIADIALYAYTHVAEEGKFDLSSYPNISKWLGRVRGQPGHAPMAAL